MSNTPPPSLTMAAGGLGAPSGQHAPLPSLPSLPSLSSLSANQGWSTTVLSAAARPLAPSRPMSALELELWIMFFLIVLVVGAVLSGKKLLPDHMFSAFTNEWWPHVDPTFMPMFIMTLCQHNTAFLNRNILYPFSLLTMMTGGQ